MATFVLTDALIFVGGTEFSDHLKSVELSYSKEVKITTHMGDTGQRRQVGLADWKATCTFYRDFAGGAAALDLLLHTAVTTQTAIRIRTNKTAAISVTNPEYQGNALLEEYPVVGGAVGDMGEVTVTFVGSDGVALIRDELP